MSVNEKLITLYAEYCIINTCQPFPLVTGFSLDKFKAIRKLSTYCSCLLHKNTSSSYVLAQHERCSFSIQSSVHFLLCY